MARPLPIRSLIALLAVVTVAALAPAAARAAEPIEGTWNYQGGRVLVEASGPGAYKGTVTSRTRFLDCDHPVGERMWDMTGQGARYTGTHRWFGPPGCTPAPGGAATWKLREADDRLLLDFCTAPPGQGEPVPANPATRCSTLYRTKPPVPSPVSVCLGAACLSGAGDTQTIGCVRRTVWHKFAIKLRRSDRRRYRVRRVSFRVDGKRRGSDRRAPFRARIDGRRLSAGTHVLTADVRTVPRRRAGRPLARRGARIQLKYRFNACD